mgnify:CR=1 FL=1
MIKIFILVFIIVVGNLSAEYMKVTLKNNTYEIYSDCSAPGKKKWSPKEYECKKEYVIKFESKYNVFENYSERRFNRTQIITDLYTINPNIYNPNKSEFQLRLSENELKQLLNSKKIKIIFDLNLFSDNLLRKELSRHGQFLFDVNVLEPTVTLDISNVSINSLKNDCSEENRICTKKLDKLNSPTNRLKRFFDL